MSEKIAVECACGYTVYASEGDIGSSVECMNCGAELDVAPPAPALEERSEVSEPDTVPESQDSAPTDTRTSAARAAAPRSPFEEDDESEPSPFAEESTGDPSAMADFVSQDSSQSPAQSPFQDDEPSDEELTPKGPFSLEAAPESKDASFSSLMEAERPKDSLRNDRVETESALDAKTGETCAECGRAIRGEWDRFPLEDRVLCYVCSNQATHGMPQRLETPKGQRELTDDDYLIDRSPPPEPEPAPWYFDPQSDIFRRVLLVLAFSTVGIALFVNIFDIGAPSEAVQQARLAAIEAAETEPEIELPFWARAFFWFWRGFAVDIGIFITLYLVLDRGNYLPRESFKGNLLYIGAVVLIITSIQVAVGVSYVFIFPGFFVGKFSYPFLWAISVVAQIIIVNRALDMRLRDWAWALLVYWPLTQILLQSMVLFMNAGIYQLVK